MKRRDSFRLIAAFVAFTVFSPTGLCQKGNPRGIYKLKTVISKGIERQHELDQYKVCTDSVTLGFRLEDFPVGGDDYFQSHVMQHVMDSWTERVLDYTGDSHPDENDKTSLIFDSDDKHFSQKWWVTHEVRDTLVFPYFNNVWCTEVYEAGQFSENGKLFFDAIMNPQPSDEYTPLIGSWRTLGTLPADKLSDEEVENLRKVYPNSVTYNRAFYIFTPSHWFTTTVSRGRLQGAFNKVTYIGTDAFRDGIMPQPYLLTWRSKDCVAMGVNGNDSIVAYIILERLTDDVPVFNRIAYVHVPRDFNWLLRDAEAGNARSQFRIAASYLTGQGVEKDIQKGREWLAKSAEGGLMEAQRALGVSYLTGEFGENDNEKAFEWLLKAAKQGEPNSQYIVARCYAAGEMVEKDDQEAVKWYELAAQNGKVEAMRDLGHYYNSLGKEEEFPKAFYYFQRAAENGDANGQNALAVMYALGRGVEQNDAKAVELYQKSADHGFPLAQRNLAFRYKGGIGVEKDVQKAYQWFLKAAEGGDASAQNEVAWMLYTGEDVPQDLEKAFEWAQKSVEGENPYGYGTLAEMYYKGKGVAQDKVKAFELYSKGGELEDRESMRMLAFMYKKGEGTKKDKSKAAYWQKKYDEATRK